MLKEQRIAFAFAIYFQQVHLKLLYNTWNYFHNDKNTKVSTTTASKNVSIIIFIG